MLFCGVGEYELTERELLLKLVCNGRIDLSEIIPADITEGIMKSIITEVHHYKITKSGDRWTTRVPDPTCSKGLRQIKKKSQADLYRYLLDFYGIIESRDITFTHLYREWAEYKRQFVGTKNKGMSTSTIKRYEKDFENYFENSTLANMKIAKITPDILQTSFKEIIEFNKDNKDHRAMYEQCFKNIYGYISDMYKYAVQKKYVKESPIKYVDKRLLLTFCEPDPVKTKDDKDRVLTIAEMNTLFAAVTVHKQKYPGYAPDYAIELVALTGMRVGEIAVLRWSDIRNGYIYVDHAEQRLDYSDKHREYIVGEPKSRKHRRIPITPEIADLFNRIKEWNKDSEYVFPGRKGEWCKESCMETALKRRAEEAGVTTCFHGIRRTVSSMLNAAGLPQITVANMLGHLPTTNERFYNYDFAEKDDIISVLSHVSHSVTLFSVNMTDKKTAESR